MGNSTIELKRLHVINLVHSSIPTWKNLIISYYTSLKDNFLNDLSNTWNKDLDTTKNDFLSAANNSSFNTLEFGNAALAELEAIIEQMFTNPSEDLHLEEKLKQIKILLYNLNKKPEEMDKALTNIFKNSTNALQLAKELSNKIRDRTEKLKISAGTQAVKDIFDAITNKFNDVNIKGFSGSQILRNSDIKKTILGFTRRWLVYCLHSKTNTQIKNADRYIGNFLSEKSIEGYANNIGGFLREQLIADNLSNAFLNYNKQIKIKVGATEITGNKLLGKEDILINFINQFKVNNYYSKDVSFGILSKSWYVPRDNDGLLVNPNKTTFIGRNFPSLGNYSAGYGLLSLHSIQYNNDKKPIPRMWHLGVLYAMTGFKLILGKNVGYSLRGDFIYTSDLAQYMFNNKYLLAFYKRMEHKNDEYSKAIKSHEVSFIEHTC